MMQVFIQFGATGDLAEKKLLPAYSELLRKGYNFHVIALGRRFSTVEAYLKHMGITEDNPLTSRISFVQYSMEEAASKIELIRVLQETISGMCDVEFIYYIALQPSLYESAAYDIRDIHESLEGCRLTKKIIVEKPFGFDAESAQKYNSILLSVCTDEEMYRIDHYLGKEFMQNLLVMRFSNDIIKGIWNKHYIDHIQIIFDESFGVDQRLGFYEQIGVVRDTIQNHILQIVTHLTMAEPVEFTPEDIAHEKVKVLRSIKPISTFHLARYASLKDASGNSVNTPTYGAFTCAVDTFDFSGIPIYIRTGKMQKEALSMIYIAFKHFSGTADKKQVPPENAMIFTLHPEMTMDIQLNMKEPRSTWDPRSVRFTFDHFKTFQVNTPEAYQQIIEKILLSDKSLFPSMREILEAWRIVTPMLEADKPLEEYPDRSLPACAVSIIEKDGRHWYA